MKLLPICLGKVSAVWVTASVTIIGMACSGSTEPATQSTENIVAAVSVTPASATLVSLGETTTLSAAAANSTGGAITGKTFTWSSSATSVATVDASSGLVTAVSNGTATITATVDGVSGTASITVAQAATTIAVSGGDGQSAVFGTAVATPPSVEVTDARGNGVEGVDITFAVATGGGTVVPTAAVATNSSGIAAVTSWTLGTALGANTLTATASGLTGSPITFTATSVPGAPTSIAIQAGDGQTADAGTAVAIAPSVKVSDAGGNGVGGVSVTFAVASGGGTVVPTTAVATDPSGFATVTSWTLGTAVGANTLTATSSGLTGSPVTFTATSVVGAPVSIAIFAGDGQTADAGTAVATAPSVKVSDAVGNGVEGVSVTFAVASGGGTVVPTTAVATNSSGIAAATSWTLGTTPGANTLNATSGGLTGSPVTFSATGVAGAPAAMAVSAGDNQSTTLNTAVSTPPAVIVTDANANPVSGVDVTFTVASGGGTVDPVTAVTTDANGIAAVNSWTLGGPAGANTLDASATGLTTVTFNATAVVPASIAINNGNGQTILAGATAVIPPSVLVLDGGAAPVSGATVNFAVTTGAGSIDGGTNTSVLTNASGIATANNWVFDAAAGANVITATVTGLGPVLFAGTGVAAGGYDIEVRILTGAPTAPQQTAFDNAEARWESLVVSELSNVLVTAAADACGITHPALNETVDDLLILVRLEAIDGLGGTLASAGPCLVRTTTVPTTAVGVMRFDTADLPSVEAAGQLETVILHEMAHLLGLGIYWDDAGFLQNPSLDAGGNPIAGQDTHFDGNHAVVAFEDRLGGSSYTGGGSVPVENEFGGQGTQDSHWRESVFVAELMTGFIDAGVANPLSLMTIASLADLGFAVNPDGADTYSQVFTAPGASYGKIALGDDIWRGPLYTVSPTGVIRRVR